MAPTPNPPLPTAAKPRFSRTFDPWNSSSSGHQRPENNPAGGINWRSSRNRKLNSQFGAGKAGGQRLSDTWGAGSEDWGAELETVVPKELKERKGKTVMDLLKKPGRTNEELPTAGGCAGGEEAVMERRRMEDDMRAQNRAERKGLFDGIVVHINGTTHPLVSDHKLKQLLIENGALMSLHLGRRKVTHVILGRAMRSNALGSAGSGLASGKLEKEVKKVRGAGVKFVGAEWVLESLKAGKRLPEARFSCAKVIPSGQSSVYGLYAGQKSSSDAPTPCPEKATR